MRQTPKRPLLLDERRKNRQASRMLRALSWDARRVTRLQDRTGQDIRRSYGKEKTIELGNILRRTGTWKSHKTGRNCWKFTVARRSEDFISSMVSLLSAQAVLVAAVPGLDRHRAAKLIRGIADSIERDGIDEVAGLADKQISPTPLHDGPHAPGQEEAEASDGGFV